MRRRRQRARSGGTTSCQARPLTRAPRRQRRTRGTRGSLGQVSILARDFPTKGSPAGMPKELFPFLTREDWAAHFAQLGAALSRNKRMLCCGREEVELIEAAFGLLDQATGLRTTVAAHSRGIQITIYFHTRE